MIVDLFDTNTSAISRKLAEIRDDGGVVALTRVLTLVISCRAGNEESAIAAANEASREHPMRVIALIHGAGAESAPRLDAQLRVGSDAGASEVVVLRATGAVANDEESLLMGLLLPDSPVVAWWPGSAPDVTSETSVGRLAQRRITDARSDQDPLAALQRLKLTYSPGDTDFAWTRLTGWRTQLAAALDQAPYEPVLHAEVTGSVISASTELLAAWLSRQLDVPVRLTRNAAEHTIGGIHGVTLSRESGDIVLTRIPGSSLVTLVQPGQPTHEVSIPRRTLRDCLAEELRYLDPDVMFAEVLSSVFDADVEAVDTDSDTID